MTMLFSSDASFQAGNHYQMEAHSYNARILSQLFSHMSYVHVSSSHAVVLSQSHRVILASCHILFLSYSDRLLVSYPHALILWYSHALIFAYSHILILQRHHGLRSPKFVRRSGNIAQVVLKRSCSRVRILSRSYASILPQSHMLKLWHRLIIELSYPHVVASHTCIFASNQILILSYSHILILSYSHTLFQ